MLIRPDTGMNVHILYIPEFLYPVSIFPASFQGTLALFLRVNIFFFFFVTLILCLRVHFIIILRWLVTDPINSYIRSLVLYLV